MSVIYTPKGAAREYSPLALNLYLQCTHGCKYCYAPSAMQRARENYFCQANMPEPRKNIIQQIERELKKDAPKEQVLLSFIGDVYCEAADENATTRKALEILSAHSVPVAILTKGGKRCLKDLEVFKRFGRHIQVGATLTFLDAEKSAEWESGAASPAERLETLKMLHKEGIQTFVSFEPVIEPEETLKLIERTLTDDSVDVYKVGKLNHYKEIEKGIDWSAFLVKGLEMIRGAGKRVYVKHDLRMAAVDVKLNESEVVADDFAVK